MSEAPAIEITETRLVVEPVESPPALIDISETRIEVLPEVEGEPVEIIISEEASTIVQVSESPTEIEVSGENVTVVTPASVGLQGPPGAAGDMVLTDYLAGEPLGGDRVVIVGDDGKLYYADNTNLSHLFRILGITTGAADLNAQANVRTGGIMNEPTWDWDLYQFIYLGTNGLLTQIVPTTGFLIVIGYPISSTKIMVDIKIPLVLA